MVVWTSAWPIHSWTRRISALAIMRVPKLVAEVVEAQPPQIGVLEGLEVSAGKRSRVDVATPVADEHEVVVSGAVFAIAKTR